MYKVGKDIKIRQWGGGGLEGLIYPPIALIVSNTETPDQVS